MGDLDAEENQPVGKLAEELPRGNVRKIGWMRIACVCLRTNHSMSGNLRRFDVKVSCWGTYSLAFIKALDVNARAENPVIHPWIRCM